MPTYKLNYFPARGLGEVSRQLLHLSGTPFEDNRITMEQWPEFKPKTPFGQMPVLEVDGKPLPQSFAIARYLAKEFGYAGKDAFESAWVDALGDQFKDYVNEIRPFVLVHYGFTEGDKDKIQKDVGEPARDKFYAILEKKAKENGNNGFLVGNSLTWIDLLIADHMDILEGFVPGFFDGFPTLLANKTKVRSCPKLKEWLDKRPVTKF